MNHTLGPWVAEQHGNGITWGVYAGDDPVVWEMGGIERESDAHLVAAAPELLEACQEAYRLMKNSPGNWESQTAEMLYEAITKAEGRTVEKRVEGP